MNTSTSATSNGRGLSLKWIRRVFSILIFYHLTAILVGPNPDNYLADKIKPLIFKYWMTFEFGSQWNFFAPEPGPAPLFLKYEIYDKNNSMVIGDQLPAYPDDYFFRDRQIRRLNFVRFIMRDDQKIYSIFVPWLCREYPEAETIQIKKVIYTIPSALEIQSGERTHGDDVGAKEYPLGTLSCEGRRST